MSSFLKLWAANGAWLGAWGAAFALCVGVFGDAAALVTIAFLVVATTAVWYTTWRRDEDSG